MRLTEGESENWHREHRGWNKTQGTNITELKAANESIDHERGRRGSTDTTYSAATHPKQFTERFWSNTVFTERRLTTGLKILQNG